jgi:hypothetical protein
MWGGDSSPQPPFQAAEFPTLKTESDCQQPWPLSAFPEPPQNHYLKFQPTGCRTEEVLPARPGIMPASCGTAGKRFEDSKGGLGKTGHQTRDPYLAPAQPRPECLAGAASTLSPRPADSAGACPQRDSPASNSRDWKSSAASSPHQRKLLPDILEVANNKTLFAEYNPFDWIRNANVHRS